MPPGAGGGAEPAAPLAPSGSKTLGPFAGFAHGEAAGSNVGASPQRPRCPGLSGACRAGFKSSTAGPQRRRLLRNNSFTLLFFLSLSSLDEYKQAPVVLSLLPSRACWAPLRVVACEQVHEPAGLLKALLFQGEVAEIIDASCQNIG